MLAILRSIVAPLVIMAGAAAPAAPPAPGGIRQPDKLVILSTTDVKGKSSPCGCHIPKGGLARRQGFADSIRTIYGQVLMVDAGYFFADNETPEYQDVANYMMAELRLVGAQAVGVSERDLKYGLAFLEVNARRSGVPLVCANLVRAKSGETVFPPYVIRKVGNTEVGIFGLMSDKGPFGPAADSIKVEDPTAVARRVVPEMKAKGAKVIVLLAQIGKMESEDLVAQVPGVDVLIVGHGGTLLNEGRMIKKTLAVYGGEQGQFMGVATLTLNPQGGMASGTSESVMMGPDTPENAATLARVKAFEDAFNDKLRNKDRSSSSVTPAPASSPASSSAAPVAPAAQAEPDHYMGMEFCARCHAAEAAQWKTTAHSAAWQTLVDAKKDATPDCIPCHVVGYKKDGGFQHLADAPKLGNVQCEMCHGMGTRHDSWVANKTQVSEQACTTCHRDEHDPEWNFALKKPRIVHSNTSGESFRTLHHNEAMMKASGSR
jgi:hypothetical protein